MKANPTKQEKPLLQTSNQVQPSNTSGMPQPPHHPSAHSAQHAAASSYAAIWSFRWPSVLSCVQGLSYFVGLSLLQQKLVAYAEVFSLRACAEICSQFLAVDCDFSLAWRGAFVKKNKCVDFLDDSWYQNMLITCLIFIEMFISSNLLHCQIGTTI